MKQGIRSRLAVLQDEYEKGRERLRELQYQQSQIEETLLRIEGAMTVLHEFLQSPEGPQSPVARDEGSSPTFAQ